MTITRLAQGSSGLLLGFSLLLSSCGAPPSPGDDPTGRWVGKLRQDEGNCPTQTNSTLVIDAHSVIFIPGDNSRVLRGTRGRDNLKFQAQLNTKDAKGRPSKLIFLGYPVGHTIGGLYGSPECRAHIVLTRTNR